MLVMNPARSEQFSAGARDFENLSAIVHLGERHLMRLQSARRFQLASRRAMAAWRSNRLPSGRGSDELMACGGLPSNCGRSIRYLRVSSKHAAAAPSPQATRNEPVQTFKCTSHSFD